MTGGLRSSVASVLAVGFLVTVTPIVAHHSAAVAYDDSKRVEAQGTVTRVLVRNPHSWVFLESADDKGQKIEWQIEMGGAPSTHGRKTRSRLAASSKSCDIHLELRARTASQARHL